MRSIAAAALGAAIILTAALSHSQAAIVPIILINGSGAAHNTDTPIGPANTSFADFFTFTSLSPFTLNFSLSSSLPGGNTSPLLTSTRYSFNSGVPTSGSQIAPIASMTFPQAAFGVYQNPGVLSAGSYYFELAGATTGGSGVDSSLTNAVTVSVSTVPIPATLPLFGAALLGLGAFAFARGKRGGAQNQIAAP